jgi:2-iminobutanoate/2-iminopropanoate deaminase
MSDAKTQVALPGAAPPTGAYSPGVLLDGWLHVSGQGPLDVATNQVVRGTIAEETRLTLSRVEAIVRAAGGTMADVVKCACCLSDLADFAEFDRAYAEVFPGVKPARTTEQAALWGGIKVEIDALARIPRAR